MPCTLIYFPKSNPSCDSQISVFLLTRNPQKSAEAPQAKNGISAYINDFTSVLKNLNKKSATFLRLVCSNNNPSCDSQILVFLLGLF